MLIYRVFQTCVLHYFRFVNKLTQVKSHSVFCVIVLRAEYLPNYFVMKQYIIKNKFEKKNLMLKTNKDE